MMDGGDPSPATQSSDSRQEPKRLLDLTSQPPKPPKLPRSAEEVCEGSEGMSQNPRIQRYLVAVEYIGTRFYGSQKQPNCRTVVGVLEEAFQKFIGQPVSVSCSSRTDAGVHALSNVCHVDLERTSKRKPGEVLPPHEPGVVRRAMNHFLQKCEGDIMVVDVRCVPGDFHARFKALERTYYYRLLSGPEPLSAFEKDRAWLVPEKLDILAMKKACGTLIGCHDFSSFRAAACQAKSPIKTLDELSITETNPSVCFPSYVEVSEIEPTDDSLIYPKTSDNESSANSLDTSSMSIPNCSKPFGQRSWHSCYVIKARARSFLYHQIFGHGTQYLYRYLYSHLIIRVLTVGPLGFHHGLRSCKCCLAPFVQVRLMVGVLKCVGTGELTISDVERILNAKSVSAASPMAPGCGLYLGNVKYEIP